ncbi:MAG: DUF1697 domain-containing protein [Thermoanaerobaculales bacterium]
MRNTFVGLIRGINVGGAKRVSMGDLRDLMRRLGYGDCRTLLNSGNMVFGGRGGAGISERIERAIPDELGIAARVIVLTAAELEAVVTGNDLPEFADDPARMHVVFVQNAGELRRLGVLEKQSWAPELLSVGKHAAYLWCPAGTIKGQLWAAVGKVLGESATTRNWATVTKLAALASQGRRAASASHLPIGRAPKQ